MEFYLNGDELIAKGWIGDWGWDEGWGEEEGFSLGLIWIEELAYFILGLGYELLMRLYCGFGMERVIGNFLGILTRINF